MRTANAKLVKLVSRTLAEQRRLHGHVVIHEVADRVVNYIQGHGGPSAYGIGAAEILMALRYFATNETKHQMNAELPENVYGRVLPYAPPILVQLMKGLPQYISLEEGPGAKWKYTLDASAEHWQQHADLKRHKAEQTLRAVNKPTDIARYLAEYGYASLGDLLNGTRST